MSDEEIKSIQKKFNENLSWFQRLIEAQDLVRRVYAEQPTDRMDIDKQLRHIDKLLTKSVNYFGEKIGSVSGEAKKVWPNAS